ncbi:CLUMA_CG012388, isoform A [Clunio marinus]|uniref:CLUMA_CG012388, isoform A n=1 Tax=Clunio marinus TaxID=568069 RepID=A0A1J1IIH4_9DIPT|nr:CLUMA_CG012388, isoform A [Clunio marinus]
MAAEMEHYQEKGKDSKKAEKAPSRIDTRQTNIGIKSQFSQTIRQHIKATFIKNVSTFPDLERKVSLFKATEIQALSMGGENELRKQIMLNINDLKSFKNGCNDKLTISVNYF